VASLALCGAFSSAQAQLTAATVKACAGTVYLFSGGVKTILPKTRKTIYQGEKLQVASKSGYCTLAYAEDDVATLHQTEAPVTIHRHYTSESASLREECAMFHVAGREVKGVDARLIYPGDSPAPSLLFMVVPMDSVTAPTEVTVQVHGVDIFNAEADSFPFSSPDLIKAIGDVQAKGVDEVTVKWVSAGVAKKRKVLLMGAGHERTFLARLSACAAHSDPGLIHVARGMEFLNEGLDAFAYSEFLQAQEAGAGYDFVEGKIAEFKAADVVPLTAPL